MLKDLVIKNRSVRGFDRSRPVTDTELREMIDCARLTASSVNMQPLKYRIVTDQEEASQVNSLTKLGARLKELGLPYKGTEPPAYIVICQDMNISNHESMFIADVGIAAQTITLAAAEMDLSCCMIGNFSADRISQELKLPPEMKIRLIIAVGRSIENITITEIDKDEDPGYYRDEAGNHFVPKRKLEDIIIR